MGDAVFVKNPHSGPPWLSGSITKICGPVSYEIKLTDGRTLRKHIDHLRSRTVTVQEPSADAYDDDWPTSTPGDNSSQLPVPAAPLPS